MEGTLDDPQEFFERFYFNIKLSTYTVGMLLMMAIFILQHVIASFFRWAPKHWDIARYWLLMKESSHLIYA
jgi:hypothetical protein